MKNTTIKDVAIKANVSASTVSRVISDSPKISQQTKERVRKIMEEMNYYPNAIARSLVKQKTDTIGLVMARSTERAFANPFFTEVIRGIAEIAQTRKYHLTISAAENYYSESRETLNLLQNGRVDGLILMAARVDDDLIEHLNSVKIPFVLIGRSPRYPELPRVDNDNILAAQQMVNFLLKEEYRQIAVIAGPDDYVVSRDRLKGCRQALSEHGLKLNEKLIKYTDFTYEQGYQVVGELFENSPQPDVIFAFDDLLAIAALNKVSELGLVVPGDLGVVGVNDQPILNYVKPGLTTIKIPIKKLGKEAAKMLIRIIQEPAYEGEEKVIPVEIVLRETHKN